MMFRMPRVERSMSVVAISFMMCHLPCRVVHMDISHTMHACFLPGLIKLSPASKLHRGMLDWRRLDWSSPCSRLMFSPSDIVL